MNPVQAQALNDILETQQVAALGTLHVSGLAAHIRDMLAHPAISLLVVAPRRGE